MDSDSSEYQIVLIYLFINDRVRKIVYKVLSISNLTYIDVGPF
jgi:hypothetical protein